ncbi:MAG: hypothetical protein ACKV22_10940 [Bryobacteraceae bacterium]
MRIVRSLALLVALGSSQLFAQLRCTAESTPPLVRAEGKTELVGDILLTCTGGTPTQPGSPLPKLNIQVSLNTQVTSRLLSSGLSEALALTGEPLPPTQTLCGSPAVPYDSTVPVPTCGGIAGRPGANVFQGIRRYSNDVVWLGVAVNPPATVRTRILRITNVRANASRLDVEPGRVVAITAEVALTLEGVSVPVTPPRVDVARAAQAVRTRLLYPRNCNACLGLPDELGYFNNPHASLQDCQEAQARRTGSGFLIQFQELSPTGFRSRYIHVPLQIPGVPVSQDVPGAAYNTESGFMKAAASQQWHAPEIGRADTGTRLTARFNNIPQGVDVRVPVDVRNGSLQIRAVTSEPPVSPYYKVPIVSGTGQAVWETINADPAARETIDIPVTVSWPVNPSSGQPALGTASVNAEPAPIDDWRFLNARPVLASAPGKGPGVDREAGVIIPEKEYIPRFRDPADGDPGLRGLAMLTIVDCGEPPRNARAALATGGRFFVTTGSLPVVHRREGNLPEPFQVYLVANGVTIPDVAFDSPSVPWLKVEQVGNSSPVTFIVTVDPSGLSPGSYNPQFRLRGTGINPTTITVPVTVLPPGPHLTRWGVTNTASYEPNLIAAGEALTLFGERFGPDSLVTAALTDGKFPTTLAETRVLFDGLPAPMLYAGKNQVSAIAPFSLAGKVNTIVQIEYRGERSTGVRIRIAPSVPGLLTADATGFGQAAALNQDNSFNSVNGELPGNYVVVFGVGGPATDLPGRDGELTGLPLPVFTGGPIKVFLDGVEVLASDIAYIGPAPNLVQGVWQANIRLPASARRNSKIQIRIQFGDFITQHGVFVSVR